MAFNPGSYQGAISSQLKSRGALSRGISSAQSAQIKGQEFRLDESNKYARLQEKASSIFGNWKRGLSLVAGLAATALGMAPLAAGLVAGVASAGGTKIGQKKAREKLDESRFYKSTTTETEKQFGANIVKDSLIAAATAYGAGTLREAGATAREAETALEAGTAQSDELIKRGNKAIAEKAIGQSPSDSPIGWVGDMGDNFAGLKTEGEDYLDYLTEMGSGDGLHGLKNELVGNQAGMGIKGEALDAVTGAKDIASSIQATTDPSYYQTLDQSGMVVRKGITQNLKDTIAGGRLKFDAAGGVKGIKQSLFGTPGKLGVDGKMAGQTQGWFNRNKTLLDAVNMGRKVL